MNFNKSQLISKANCHAVNSSKKRTNEFVFTSMRCVFVRFLEEIKDSKKAFQKYLTFSSLEGILNNPRPENNVSRLSDLYKFARPDSLKKPSISNADKNE